MIRLSRYYLNIIFSISQYSYLVVRLLNYPYKGVVVEKLFLLHLDELIILKD